MLLEHAGGVAALHRLEQAFYDSVLRDPLLQPLFGSPSCTPLREVPRWTWDGD